MEIEQILNVFAREASLLEATLRHYEPLRPLFSRDFAGVDAAALKLAYLQLLKLKVDYVQYTVPALRAAGRALKSGDAEDRRWSELLLEYADGEHDGDGDYGHDVWARQDMQVLGAPPSLLDAPPHPSALLYGRYFVDDVPRHPYAILGAKGVLEQFSIRVSDDLVRGLVESGIPDAAKATTFFSHHGVLDIDHVREGARNLIWLDHAHKRDQVVEAAYFTSGVYRTLVHGSIPG